MGNTSRLLRDLSRSIFFTLVLILIPRGGEARVFRFGNEKVAFVLGATSGVSELKQTHFEKTSGASIKITDSVKINQSGEIGVLFKTKGVGLKLVAENIAPTAITGAKGIMGVSSQIHSMDSSISALIIKLGAEFELSIDDIWRTFAFGSYGAGVGTLINSYQLTATGQAAYPGLADFTDQASGTFPFYEIGAASEILLSDTTTLTLGFGYRQLNITKFKFTEAVTNFNGTYAAGATVLDSTGAPVQSDFGGVNVMLQLRIYLK